MCPSSKVESTSESHSEAVTSRSEHEKLLVEILQLFLYLLDMFLSSKSHLA